MQTLWSRAAPAQSSCCCRICLHSTASALARRSTTTATRRRASVADIFTACYTTILGTAAIIDARHKNERRRELDGELDRARASLKRLNAQGHHDSTDGENGAPHGARTASGEIRAHLKPWRGDESVRPLLEELKSLCNIAFRPVARRSWIEGQIDWVSVEAAVMAEERNPSVELREPLTHHHLAATTVAVFNLARELLRLVRISPSSRLQDEAQISDHAEEGIMKELKELTRNNHFPSYQFPTADPSYTADIRARLNRSIRRIFYQAVTPQETVGRICYNLLTIGVPPAIHTYNTLITGFNRMQRPDLAQAVINSYLDNTIWPATDQTVICLLSHYRGPGGREGLRDAVQRMRGAREDGLHLATFREDRYNAARLPGKRRTPKAKRIDVTFDHLIRGWLYHEEVGIACMTFVACLRNGASLPVYTLHELFRSCLATADFSSARKLLTGIVQNFEKFKTYLSWIIENNAIAVARGLLQSLHQIINICWLPFSEIFGETHKTYAEAATSLEAIISHMDVQLEVQEAALGLPSPSSGALNLLEPALTHFQLAISTRDRAQFSKRTWARSESVYARIAMLVSIDRRFGDLEERAQNLTAAFKAAIIGIKTGYEIDVGPILSSNFLGSQIHENQRFATRRALSQIDVSDDHLTIEDIASQLLRCIPDPAQIRLLEENGNWKRLSIPTLISFFGSNAVSTRPRQEEEESRQEFSHSYMQLEEQFQVAKDSIKALLFAHLTRYRQQGIMHDHGIYNKVTIRGLGSFLHTELKYRLPVVLQTTPQSQYNEFSNTYDATTSLERPGQEEPASQNHGMPFEADNSTPDTETGLGESWGTTDKHEKHDPLSLFREEGLCLQSEAPR
ncbi:hypothetical protein F4824DRAFT_385729 [Ustulina deusta]|nr:hypothetical protein F4823DRAFT_29351 [Ustulina deusta]KAI3329527.1 hypothetical protein F4824DRAFT_385729 [Ustulina deusta]